MFLGTHRPRLDEKNRVILPAKFRDALADGLVMTKGQDRCLVVWTKSAFATYAAELRAQGASPVHQVAVAFDGKRVLVGLAEAQRRKGAASRAR